MDLPPVIDKYHDIAKLIIMEMLSQSIQDLEFLNAHFRVISMIKGFYINDLKVVVS
jgi:hypothetical protein